MTLEGAIQQEKFESEHHKVAVNVLFTSGWLYHLHAGYLKPYHLTPEQFNVLRILRGSHPRPLRLADITRRMLDKSSNATRLVEKLRQKDLVTRKLCETNRRQVDIHITPKGLSVLERIENGTAAWTTALASLTTTEAKELNRLLDKLRN